MLTYEQRREAIARVGELPLLRAVCQRAGVQLRARDMDLSEACAQVARALIEP